MGRSYKTTRTAKARGLEPLRLRSCNPALSVSIYPLANIRSRRIGSQVGPPAANFFRIVSERPIPKVAKKRGSASAMLRPALDRLHELVGVAEGRDRTVDGEEVLRRRRLEAGDELLAGNAGALHGQAAHVGAAIRAPHRARSWRSTRRRRSCPAADMVMMAIFELHAERPHPGLELGRYERNPNFHATRCSLDRLD